MTIPSNVHYKVGDLFTSEQPAIGHGVNIRGIMGSGIAVIFKRQFPEIFPPYKEACDNGMLTPGSMLPVEVDSDTDTRWVFNLASQDEPGANARMDWVEDSAHAAFHYAEEEGVSGLALPRIASGVGGLVWADVKLKLEEVAAQYPSITLELWSTPDAK
jgi:O-acetyl-ADP-ribose deacetylase (regulator of RNase III)